MIQFFGNETVAKPPVKGEMVLNMADMFAISDPRAAELVAEIFRARDASKDITGIPANYPVPAELFSLHQFFEKLELDTASPGELVFVGLILGKIYAQMEQAGTAAMEKAMEEISKDPKRLAALMLSLASRGGFNPGV